MSITKLRQMVQNKDDVASLLREAKRLATKLNDQNMLLFIKNEQKGYIGVSKEQIPSYRKFNGGQLYAVIPGFMKTPVGFEGSPISLKESFSSKHVANPIGELTNIKDNTTISIIIPLEVEEQVLSMIDSRIGGEKLVLQFPLSNLISMHEAIRNIVYDWTLAISDDNNTEDNPNYDINETRIILNNYGVINGDVTMGESVTAYQQVNKLQDVLLKDGIPDFMVKQIEQKVYEMMKTDDYIKSKDKGNIVLKGIKKFLKSIAEYSGKYILKPASEEAIRQAFNKYWF